MRNIITSLLLLPLLSTLTGCAGAIIGGVAGGTAVVACTKGWVWPCKDEPKPEQLEVEKSGNE